MMNNFETLRNESGNLEENEIQGLHSARGACKSFWSLRAIVELSEYAEKGEQRS